MKRKLIFLISFLLIIGASIGGFFYYMSQQETSYNPINAIPVDAAMFLKINDFKDVLDHMNQENNFWQKLVRTESLSSFHAKINHLQDHIHKYDNLSSIVSKYPLYISFHKLGKKDVRSLYYINAPNLLSQKLIQTFFNKLYNENQVSFSKRTYNGTNLYQAQISSTKKIYYTLKKGLFIASKSSILLEKAIRQTGTDFSFLSQKGFKKVYNAAGNFVDANIYVNYKNISEVISPLLSYPYNRVVKTGSPFGDWAEFDIKIQDNTLFLNGFTYARDSVERYTNLFKNIKPQKTDMTSVIPANAPSFLIFGITDLQTFHNNLKEYLQYTSSYSSYDYNIEKLEKTYDINLIQTVNSFLGSEIGLVFSGQNDQSTQPLMICETKSKTLTKRALTKIIEIAAKKENKDYSDYINTWSIDKSSPHKIYKMPVEDLPQLLFGSTFKDASSRYFTFYNNYLVFGNSISDLSKYLHINILQKTINNVPAYKNAAQYISSSSNFFYYLNIQHAQNFLPHFLGNTLIQELENNLDVYRSFSPIIFQFSKEGSMFYNNICIPYTTKARKQANTEWERMLDTTMNFKPFFFVNHYTKEKEIFVQDMSNTIYLINKEGRILWQRPLNEKIMSKIFMIDYYDNSKNQLLFNTKHRIHCIARNGNDVADYPIRLRSPATNGMNLFTYDNNKRRIFIATENHRVYDYNLEGDILEGWEFKKTETDVTTKIQHFKIDTKDYIVFADNNRIYILNRRGHERIKPETFFRKAKHSRFFLDEHNPKAKPRFVTTDNSGTVQYIYQNGTVEQDSIKEYSPSHYFMCKDVNTDGYKDYIYVDKNKLEVFNQNKKKLFTHSFEANITKRPDYYIFSYRNKKIGIVSDQKNKIYLFNSDGSLYDGFPLQGATRFTIGPFTPQNQNYNLVVGNNNMFLYNYSLNASSN